MRLKRIMSLMMAALTATALWAAGDNDRWPQWRGPDRNGVVAADNLMETWPEGGLDQVWRLELGDGFSTIAVSGDTLFTMRTTGEGEERQESAVAIAADTGKIRWETVIGKAFVDEFGDGPRATTSLADGMVFAVGSYGKLMALSQKDGSEVWSVDFKEKFESETPRWGFSTSPLVDNGMIITEVGGGEGQAIAAFDTKTGEVRWTAVDGNAGYASPIAVTMNNVRQYVFVGRGNIFALGSDGKELWKSEWEGGTVATPIFIEPNRFFISASDDTGATLIQVNGGEGDDAVESVWVSRQMRNHFNSSVLVDGYVYGFDNATLKCIELATGEMKWRVRGHGKGSLIAAGDYLFVLSDRGKLTQAKITAEGFKPVGSMQALNGKSWSAPTYAHGRIYLRNHTEIVSFQAAKPNPEDSGSLR